MNFRPNDTLLFVLVFIYIKLDYYFDYSRIYFSIHNSKLFQIGDTQSKKKTRKSVRIYNYESNQLR